jgi:two-component system, NtrC family, sensor histidine kinase PilS
VQREAERLSGLVHSFLTYARPAEPRAAPLALPGFLEETATAVSHGLRSAQLSVGQIPLVHVNVDADQLRQVLWNVITNADKVGESVQRRLEVRLGAAVVDNTVIITVEDDGPGVPADLRQRIFEPFFTTRPDGNGLGLATSHQLVAQNGGVMGVQAGPSLGGALFTIRFPMSVTEVAALASS